jgi:hypothetical protein
MRRRRSGGGVLLETALWTPFLLMLFLGTAEFARLTWTYYTLKKVLYDVARSVGTQQGVNFCDQNDQQVAAAKNRAVTGTDDGTGNAVLPNLTAEQLAVRIERYMGDAGGLAECSCEASATGCDASGGAPGPDYIVVYLPEGYPLQLRIPGLQGDPIPLKPQVRLPYGGT